MNHTLPDILWVGLTAVLVFIMQAGFAFLETGMTRSKNSINVAIKNLTDLGVSVLVYWGVGFGLMFGLSESGLVGSNNFLFHASSLWGGIFFLFQAMFCSTSATIVSGAVAERMKFLHYILATVFLSGAIYPVTGHWIWGGAMEGQSVGLLNSRGFVDFAGSTAVHSVGGWISLAALLVIGPRIGRYNKDGTINKISGSNIPASVFGVIILWFGWFGFNGGSTLALNEHVPQILTNTLLGGASGMVLTLVVGWIFTRRPDVDFVINGALAGLVAITANCHVTNESQALLIGGVGGLVMLAVQALMDKLRIDDAVGAIPVHLGAGIWGTLAVGLFGNPDQLGTGLSWGDQILVQAAGIGLVGAYSFFAGLAFFWLLNMISKLRVTEDHELKGLNVAEHDATTEIYDLYRTLDAQAKTGDLSLRAPVEPFTEVGQIASQYNRVMDNLQHNLVAKSEYLHILDHVGEGLFLIDTNGTIGPFYSAALESLMEDANLAGRDLRAVLRPLVPEPVAASLDDFLDVLFDKDIDLRNIHRINPLARVEVFFDQGNGEVRSKHLGFHFRRILENGEIVRVMVNIQDLTPQVTLERTVEATRKEKEGEMELFYRIIHLDPSLLKDFLTGFDEKMNKINRVMETGQNVPQEVLKQAFRMVHAIKGEASFLELDFIAETAHDLETRIATLQKKKPLENADFLALALRFGDLQETGRKMDRLLAKLSAFQSTFVTGNRSGIHPLTATLERLLVRTARDQGKLVEVQTDQFDAKAVPAEHLMKVKDILIQLGKNAIVHGIETPELRREAGKDEAGILSIKTEVKADSVAVVVRDDGQGLNLEKLRLKALELGRPAAEVDTWTKADYVKFLFTDGVSTADTLTREAGRGVGTALVRDLVKTMKARLGVSFNPGEFLEFRITLPRS